MQKVAAYCLLSLEPLSSGGCPKNNLAGAKLPQRYQMTPHAPSDVSIGNQKTSTRPKASRKPNDSVTLTVDDLWDTRRPLGHLSDTKWPPRQQMTSQTPNELSDNTLRYLSETKWLTVRWLIFTCLGVKYFRSRSISTTHCWQFCNRKKTHYWMIFHQVNWKEIPID